MDIEHSIGTIRCDGCDAKYDARISRLSDPIDVYAEWIDQCEAVNVPGAGPSNAAAAADGEPDVLHDGGEADDDF